MGLSIFGRSLRRCLPVDLPATLPGNIVGYCAFLFELVFRPLLCLMLVGLFVWLLTVGDQMDDHRIAGQGLPRTKGWLKQFVLGTVVGCVLTLIAVVPIHYWGHFVFKHDRGWKS